MSIGETVRQIRESREMLQKDLAEKIGVSQSMICQIERGTKVLTLPLGRDIARALGCSLDDLTKDAS